MAEDNGALMYAMGRDSTNNNGGFGGMNGWGDLAALLVVAGIFGGGWGGFGVGWGGGGATAVGENYVLATDFATIERKLDSVSNGICSLGYNQLEQMNGINMNIAQNGYETRSEIAALGYNLQNCCCQTQRSIDGVNYNNAQNTRDIIEATNAGTRAILDKLCHYEIEQKNERIAEQQAQITALNLAASQQAQNAYLINQLRPSPVPAYPVFTPNMSFVQPTGVTFGVSGNNNCCCNGANGYNI